MNGDNVNFTQETANIIFGLACILSLA